MIDPRLTESFAVIRDGRSSPEAVPTADDVAGLEKLGSAPAAERYGLVLTEAVKASVGPSRDVLVVPGERGVFLFMPDGRGGFVGFGAVVETALRGQPIGSSGSTLFGLAPDGVTHQPVTLSDGSVVHARVVRNLYTVDDPHRASR